MKEARRGQASVSPEEQQKTAAWLESVKDSMRDLGAAQANVGLVVLICIVVLVLVILIRALIP